MTSQEIRAVNSTKNTYSKLTALNKGLQFNSTDESYLEIGSLTDIDFTEGVTFVFRGSTRDPLTNDLLNSPGYNIITFEEDTSYIEIVNDCVNVVNVAGFTYSTIAADYRTGIAPFANGVATTVITFDTFDNSNIYVLGKNGYDRLVSVRTGTYSYLTRPNVFAMARNLSDSLDYKLAYYERWQLYNAVLTEAQIVELRTNWNVSHSDTVFDIGTNAESIDENTWTNITVEEDVEIITEPVITTFGSLSDDVHKWSTGALADNGSIYAVPHDATSVLKIDPINDSTTTFGSLSSVSGKWQGCVRAENGFLYGIPRDATDILKIDPTNDTISTFGNFSGTEKWQGGVLAQNGFIYGIPKSSATVLKIDPTNDTTTTFGNLPGNRKWVGGVLAENGFIYGIPLDSAAVLKIDPINSTTTTFSSLSGTAKWIGGVLAQTGIIYGIPLNSTSILKIDPTNDTTSRFGSLSGTLKWGACSLAANGMIYAIAYGSTAVLEIDPITDSVTEYGSFSGSFKWFGGALAENGSIYGIPRNSTSVLKISNVGQQSSIDNQIPSPISDLPTSNYNKFHNKL